MEIINGDLLKSSCIYIAHQVNCMGKMNSGVAKQIRETYPIVFKEYQDFIEINKDILPGKEMLGHSLIVQVNDIREVINIFGQYGYGYDGHQYTNYEALKKGFTDAIRTIRDFDLLPSYAQIPIAMPFKIGCCRGGGKWDEGKKILEQLEKEENVLFLAYKL